MYTNCYKLLLLLSMALLLGVRALELPGSCNSDEYYNSALLSCQICPANTSMIKSADGFSCTCDDHSIPAGPGRCKPCNVTEIVSSDGTACVPRKCQNLSGRVACRKCPDDYISVTQNLDGSPMREVQCIKCARGYKANGNTCVRCESCTCARNQIVVKGICVPKVYVNGRPSYAEKLLHPLELLDIVKHEYLCTKNDIRMCQALANKCVKSFYSSDFGGPCRLWLEPKLAPKGLPSLVSPNTSDRNPGQIKLPRGKGVIYLAVASYPSQGGMIFLNEPDKHQKLCQLPLKIKIGNDVSLDCSLNLTKLSALNGTLSAYIWTEGDYKPLHVTIQKPSGYNVQRGSWPNTGFSRYFIVHNSLSTTTNATNSIYLRKLLILLRIERERHGNGSLRLQISIEAQFASAGHLESVTSTLKVEHLMPSAGVIRGLEITGGIFGAFLTLYALVQWRGVLRRGGAHYSIVPILAGSIADTLYFSALLATLHALAAEAGTLGMTLPLSRAEEQIIKAFLFSAVSLKALKVTWINWKQCTTDIIFLDWTEYNPPVAKDVSTNDNVRWKTLAREWSLMQTMRRASPGFTVTGALLILHLMTPWQTYLPPSLGYRWAVASIAWWSSYAIVLLASWLVDRIIISSTSDLLEICTRVDLSLLVFQEEYYAHYVHGRNDDSKDVRSMAGPLTTCRVACVPQLRAICKQLSTPAAGVLGENEPRHALLSKFLAAFFERALDGLNWVASERTVLERLLDVELTTREAGGTSALLYDDDSTPSCFCMTWWGEEWTLSTFDAMIFSCVLIASGDSLLAALLTIFVWQVLKLIRTWLGNRNQVLKSGVDIHFR